VPTMTGLSSLGAKTGSIFCRAKIWRVARAAFTFLTSSVWITLSGF
jgi:hypothetical protein